MAEFSSSKFKVAAAQVAPVWQNKEATVDKAIKIIEEAARNGAKLIVFPECFISGFPRYSTFETPEITRRKYPVLLKNAVEVPGREVDLLCEVARQNEINVVIGVNEKEKVLDTLYNTQVFISSDGKFLGKHRKLVPTFTEKLIYCGGDGSTINVFETDIGRVGGLICGEHNNPLLKFAVYAMGERIHAASWPPFPPKKMLVHREYVRFASQQYALEGKVFVVAATGYFSREMLEDIEPQFREGLEVGGAPSLVVSPNYGRIIAEASADTETIIYGEIDLDEGIPVKLMHDVTGHYNRFDIFSLIVNRTKQQPLREYEEKASKEQALGSTKTSFQLSNIEETETW